MRRLPNALMLKMYLEEEGRETENGKERGKKKKGGKVGGRILRAGGGAGPWGCSY